jgi:arylsulfatase A-like enzyme
VISDGHQLLLMVLDGVTLGAAGALAATPLLLIPRLRSAWAGFLWGVTAMTIAALGEWWFTAPPSFVAAQPGASARGNTLLFVLAVLGLGALFLALAAAVRAPRLRIAVALGLTFAFTSRSLTAGRDLLPLGDPPDSARNVLLVTFDTTRADHFGAYGSDRAKTPRFDELAEQGALITDATAPIPVTGPSHTTILSGQPPWQHGALLNGVAVNSSSALLAEHLRARGWRTGAFVSAYVLDGGLGFSRGFEIYDDDFSWLQGWSDTLPGRFLAAATRRFSPAHVLERRGGWTVDQALDWMEPAATAAASGGRPFFGWVHLFDPHGPYNPPPPWDTAYYEGDPRDPAHTSMDQVEDVSAYLAPSLEGITDLDWVLAQYAGEISYMDEQLGRLLDALDTLKVANNTLVVVVGDHGESLTEHGVWFDHGDDLFSPSVHVPMAIRLPGTIDSGTRITGPVELTDVAPTIYDLLDVEAPSTSSGSSVGDALYSGVFSARPEARSLTFDRPINLTERRAGRIDKPTYRMAALRRPGQYLYIYRDAPSAENTWYDLSSSDGEGAATALPPGLQSLQDSARTLLEEMSAEDLQRSTTEPDKAAEERLRALGYIE